MKLGKVGYLVVFFHFMNGDFFDTSFCSAWTVSTPRRPERFITTNPLWIVRHFFVTKRNSTFGIVKQSFQELGTEKSFRNEIGD